MMMRIVAVEPTRVHVVVLLLLLLVVILLLLVMIVILRVVMRVFVVRHLLVVAFFGFPNFLVPSLCLPLQLLE